jgi:TonB-linked SusC/RagA family outer membrane protein
MRVKMLCMCLLLGFIGRLMAAPTETIRGRVTDQQTGKPLAGVSVTIKGKRGGVSTNDDGWFTLNIPADKAILVISSIGYTTVEQPVTAGTSNITISLVQDQKGMGEVVVTALGIQRTAKSLTYAAQRVGGDQINEVRDASFANTLSGKVAGLTITPSANGPGGATRVLLRGNRSIQGNNNALIVVDGVAIDNQSISGEVKDDAGSGNMGQSGSDGLSQINPDDIESMSVLKGASGAALYGSRAANGVIMITTKRGKTGRMNLSLNSGLSAEQAFSIPKVQDQYSQGAAGNYSTATGNSWGAKIAGQSVTDWRGKTVNLQAFPNNTKDFYRTAFSTNNAIGLTAGSDKLQTYLSYANNNATGIVPGNRLMRNTFNGRFGINITDRLSADAKVTYIVQNIYNKPGVGGDGLVAANVYRIPTTVNQNDLKDYKTVDVAGLEKPTFWTNTDAVIMNPYWTVNNTHRDENRSRIMGLLSLKYKLTDWLNIQGRVSSDSYNDFNTSKYANLTANYARQPGGYYSEEYNFVSERNFDVLLNGNNDITRDLKVTYNLGSSLLDRGSRHRIMAADGLAYNNKFDLLYASGALKQTVLTVKRQLQSVYGTAQFSFKDYLYLDVTAREDWSSTIPEPFHYFYPSVGLGAILSDMMKMPSWVSLAKVRGSLTRVGNDADPYLLAQTYNFIPGGFGGYIASSSDKRLPTLKPEITTALEVGTEWRLWNDRFGVDLTYYKTNSKNQLLSVVTPASSGFSTALLNAGNIQNSGIEVVLTAMPLKTRDFSWNLGVNYALNINKVISLAPNVPPIYLGSSDNVRTATPRVTVGGSYGDLYGYKWARTSAGQFVVDTSTGLPAYSALTSVGNFNPNYTIGFSNTFNYKGWSLGILVDGKFGGVIVSGTESQMAYMGMSTYTTQYRDAGSWILPATGKTGGTNTKSINAEKFWQEVTQGNYAKAEFFTYDATNVRIREVTLGYDFKRLPSFLKAAKLSFVARNLLFLYRGKSVLAIPGIGKRKLGIDPEASFGNSNYQGAEYYNLPTTRSMGLNLKLSF